MLAAMFCARGTRGQKFCFGPRLLRTWGACVELVVRCPIASKGLAGRGDEREKSLWLQSRASTRKSLYLLPLALASGLCLRQEGRWQLGFKLRSFGRRHTRMFTSPLSRLALGGVLVVLGGHTNHNRPFPSLTKHSKDQ